MDLSELWGKKVIDSINTDLWVPPMMKNPNRKFWQFWKPKLVLKPYEDDGTPIKIVRWTKL